MRADASSWAPPRQLLALAESRSALLYTLGFWLALVQISIAASQIVLTFVVMLWCYHVATGKLELVRLPLDAPIAAFAILSLAATAFSFDPATSLSATKKLVLLVVPYIVVSVLRPSSASVMVTLLIGVGDLAAILGLWQYFFGDLGDLHHRIRGFMSHYMTFSGQLMAVGTLAMAELFLGRNRRFFALASTILIYTTLILTLTRSAWLGVLAAMAVIFFMKDRRLFAALPVVVAAALFLVPQHVSTRVESFLRPDTSGLDRIYMLQSGARMTANHPWLGVGPNMVELVYPIYSIEGAPHHENVHLHNNVAQIAAERGIPCLIAWLWLIVVALRGALRAYQDADPGTSERPLAAGALALLVAGLVAGLFEYNYGDSEFQMLFSFGMGIPFVLQRARDEGLS